MTSGPLPTLRPAPRLGQRGPRTVPLQGGHRVQLLQGGDALFPALCAAIEAAHHEVLLASYIVHTDTAACSVRDALARAARRGVRVRVVVDGFGSRHALPQWRAPLEAAGAALAVFRPIDRWWHWLQPRQLRRLHQKLCVVDGAQAFVGGINLLDDRFDLGHGVLPAPRLDFAVRFEGPAVQDVERQLRRLWARSWVDADLGDGLRRWMQAPDRVARARRWWRDGLDDWRRAWPGPRTRAADPVEGVRLAYVARDNLRQRTAIEREYLAALRQCRTRFDLICPYFYPTHRLLRALLQAARRGVRVRLLLQGRADYRLARWAAQALYAVLLPAGVQVYEYRTSFLHAKVAVADADWVTLGSSNLDPTSLLLNLEANVVLRDADLAGALRTTFEAALVGSTTVAASSQSHGLLGWLRRGAVAAVARLYLRVAGRGW